MSKLSIVARLTALGASVVVTFAIVAVLADYGLPGDGTEPVLALASTAAVK